MSTAVKRTRDLALRMSVAVKRARGWGWRRRRILGLALLAATLLLLFVGPSALAADVYGNIGPAPQLTGGLMGRYPIANYQLDQYFPAIQVGLFSGVSVSGVLPMIAFFIAQVIWLLTAFIAYVLITLFAFAFSLELVNGNGTPGSGALAPVSQAIHNIYASTFGQPWLVAAVALVAIWAIWKALVQRRYSETASTLALSLAYCLLALAIVTAPQATIAPASRYANRLATGLLSLSSQGSLTSSQEAKRASSNQLFSLLVLTPWTVLEFGGTEHCTKQVDGNTVSVAVRPLSNDPDQEAAISQRLENSTEIKTPSGKTCINNELKYAPHFLPYAFQSQARNQEYEALEHGTDQDLPESDPAKRNGSYPLGPADEPAAEAAGKNGQYQRLLLSVVIAVGELGAFLLLGSLAVGVIVAGLFLLFTLAFAPFALVLGVIPGRGHEFFRGWLTRLAGYLLRKVIYAAILALVLAVCHALADATSNLGWLMAFGLQALFLWSVFLQRHRITNDLLAATAGTNAGRDTVSRLQTLYYTTRLTRMAGLHQGSRAATPARGHAEEGVPPPTSEATPPRAGGLPEADEHAGEPTVASQAPQSTPEDRDADEEPS